MMVRRTKRSKSKNATVRDNEGSAVCTGLDKGECRKKKKGWGIWLRERNLPRKCAKLLTNLVN